MSATLPSGVRRSHAASTRGNALPAVSGLAVLITGGVLAALLAARWLDPGAYTVFAAFSAVLGLLVLGPASSLEQESALYGRSRAPHATFMLRMGRRAAVLWAVSAILVLVPLAGWQERLWGDASSLASALIVLGAAPIFMLAIARGIATAHDHHRLVGTTFAVVGVAMVAFPLLLHATGIPLMSAFLAGAVVAWAPGVVILAVFATADGRARPAPGRDGAHPRRVTALVALGNLLVLGNLLAVPAVLRWHVNDLNIALVADVQLLVSLTRLSTTAVLGFLPLAIARVANSTSAAKRFRDTRALIVVAFGMGVIAVVGSLLFADDFVAGLTGRPTALTGGVTVLATLPVVALCPALILTGVAVTQRRHFLVIGAWGCGLLALGGALTVNPGGVVELVLAPVLLAAVLPLLVLASASALRPATITTDEEWIA